MITDILLTDTLRSRCAKLVVWLAICCLNHPIAGGQEPIILRDLSIIRDQEVVEFDARVIRLNDGRELSWDQVLKASVGPIRQAEFNANVSEIGLPLWRLKYRLQNLDWAGVSEITEPLYARLEHRSLEISAHDPSPAGIASDHLICIATMRSRLRSGNHAAAVLPFLQAAKLQSRIEGLGTEPVVRPTWFLSEVEARQLFSSQLLPIWFDRTQAEEAFSKLANSFVPTSNTPDQGAVIYLASLAIHCQRLTLGEELLQIVATSDDRWQDWALILQSQILLAKKQLPSALAKLPDDRAWSVSAAPVASYVRAVTLMQLNEAEQIVLTELTAADIQRRSDLMLAFLSIAAEHGTVHRELSAAAVFQAAQIAQLSGWQKEQRVLEAEVIARFPGTYFASQLGSQATLQK